MNQRQVINFLRALARDATLLLARDDISDAGRKFALWTRWRCESALIDVEGEG